MDYQFTVVGIAFAICAGIFFLGAVPNYALRYSGPGKPPPLPRGKVSTEGFGLIDVIGVSIFFGWYALNWVLSKRALDGKGGEGAGKLSEMENLPVLLGTQLVFQVMMVAAVVLFVYWRMNLVRAAGLRWRHWPLVFLIAPLTVFVMWSFMATLQMAGYSEWIAGLTGEDPGKPSQDSVRLFQETESTATIIMMALVACIGAPLAEEVVFRGYIYGAVKRFSNIGVAVIFSGLLFGAVHLNLGALLPLTVLGIVLAVLYEVTGSLWAPIAVHFLFNSSTVALQLVMRYQPEWFEEAQKNAAIIGNW